MAFGRGPLSHPLLVDAIETAFVPAAVRNNVGGQEKEWLERYEEPTWNNPVVRFFGSDGAELLPRKDRVWSTAALCERVCLALEAGGSKLPAWLAVAREETREAQLERVSFAMHCYWVGEATLGAIEGVRGTRAAWLEGREVVEVSFDPARLPLAALVAHATDARCADRVYATGERQLAALRELVGEQAVLEPEAPKAAKESDQLHALRASPLRFLPLTALQARRVNAALAAERATEPLLSPTQRALSARVARALARDAEALDGLVRPDAHAELAAYTRELETRLGPTEN